MGAGAGEVGALRDRPSTWRAAPCGVAEMPDGNVLSAQPDGSEPWRPCHWTSAWRLPRDRAGIDKSGTLPDQ